MHGTDQSILLHTHQLSVGYPPATILFENLSLELKAGELVCFMGPNGVGKSTLIRTLAGLQKPLHGQVTLGTDRAHLAQYISLVLTDKLQVSNITVRELVALGRYPYLSWNIRLTEQDQHVISNALQSTHTDAIAHKKLYEISDGQMQMALIARALAQDGRIIILDEPTAHLDLNNRVEIMNLLRTLARRTSKAILVSTHELDLALQSADVIWLAGNQRELLTGVPEDLVLSGAFDDIFRFKGFDLKTGKIFQEAHRGVSIEVTGEGHTLLWTKNALERSGFEIRSGSNIQISVVDMHGGQRWLLKHKGQLLEFDQVKKLLAHLTTLQG
jgi:iron complex transport system ATP-binding protein